MSARQMDDNISKFARLYRDAMKVKGFPLINEKTESYISRLREMYASQQYKEHNVYPTMDVSTVYAVIAMCLELRRFGLSDNEIITFSEVAFNKRRAFFDRLIRIIDLLPNSYRIARKWNINDHARRVVDHSITYDYFNVTENSVTYRISKCMYVEMFESYGIRELCKIFCDTDIRAYAGLTRHVRFIRHSDLSHGDCCCDEVHRK